MDLLNAALSYAEHHLRVMPCRPRGKQPLTTHGVNDASADPAVIKTWWAAWPQANVAIALPRNLVVLDVDSADEFASFLSANSIALPDTSLVRTGKGRHLYYRLPEGVSAPNAVRPFPGADLRSLGGYVLAPPSIHPSGFEYCWERPLQELTDAPAFLLDAARPVGAPASASVVDWSRFIAEGVQEGGRNDAIARLAGKLLHHLPPDLAFELLTAFNEARCKPPLSLEEVSRTFNSIAGREKRTRQQRSIR